MTNLLKRDAESIYGLHHHLGKLVVGEKGGLPTQIDFKGTVSLSPLVVFLQKGDGCAQNPGFVQLLPI